MTTALQIQFSASFAAGDDKLTTTRLAGSGPWYAVNSSLATRGRPTSPTLQFAYIHANLAFMPVRVPPPPAGARTPAEIYRIDRRMRLWFAPLSTIDVTTGGYTYGFSNPEPVFHEDSGPNPSAVGHFDAPAVKAFERITASTRQLQEFVITLRHPSSFEIPPDSSALYYVVVIDVTPTHYRIWVSAPRTLEGAEFEDVVHDVANSPLPASAPWQTKQDIDAIASGWLASLPSPVDWSAINQKLRLGR